MYLGLKGDELATISEIAATYEISRNHLMKVVYELSQHGYIETIRGKKGGMRLRLEPSAINLGELVRCTESDMALVECFGPDNSCCLTPSCALRSALNDALQAFLAALDRYTLADLLTPRRELKALLWMDIPVQSSAEPPRHSR
jgi:Rrf2 family nitric oxide-sensitive transcriptional repressor